VVRFVFVKSNVNIVDKCPLVNKKSLIMSDFSERLKSERKKLGLNQADFGAAGGVKKDTQLNYERGDRNPDYAYLQGIAAIGADVSYLLFGVIDQSRLSNDENEVLVGYRALDVRGKAGVLALIGSMGEKGNAPRAVFHGNVAQVVQGNQTTKDVTFTVESGNKKKNLEHD